MKIMIVRIHRNGKTVEGKFNYKYYHDTFSKESIVDIVDIAYPNDFICEVKEINNDATGVCEEHDLFGFGL